MVVVVASRPSFKKSHQKPKISLNSLPEDLLVEISSCVAAASSLTEINNLKLVSKPFQRFSNEPYVVRRLSLHKISYLLPWFHNREKFTNFFKTCQESQNPQALYRKGLVDYFIDQQQDRGIEFLAKAAEKGNQEARYVYGMILICSLGCRTTKQMGFKILSSLIKPLMSDTMEVTQKLRQDIIYHISWIGDAAMRQLKGSYVRENCSCDGRTEKFINCDWHRVGEDDVDMITSSACEICLCHREVQLFFHDI